MLLLTGGTVKLYFKNVIVISFIECVKLTFSERPQNIIMYTWPRDIPFGTSFGRLLTNLRKNRSCFYIFFYMSTYTSVCLPIVNIEKTTI